MHTNWWWITYSLLYIKNGNNKCNEVCVYKNKHIIILKTCTFSNKIINFLQHIHTNQKLSYGKQFSFICNLRYLSLVRISWIHLTKFLDIDTPEIFVILYLLHIVIVHISCHKKIVDWLGYEIGYKDI